MISFFRKYQRAFFIATIVIFLIGTFVGLGGYLFTSRDTSGAVASVGSTKIPYQRYAVRVNQYLDALQSKGTDVTDDVRKEVKQGMLRDMIVDTLLEKKADEMGIVVTDEDLARDIQSTPAFQRDGQFNQDVYFQMVRSVFHEGPEQFETDRRSAIKVARFKQMIYQSAKVAPSELQELYAQANKGSMKNFEKDKAAFTNKVQQQKALEIINYYLRQLSAQVEIRSFLDQREQGS
jgi:peptidyl-prolyl cis-trans isomerase D